MNDFRTKHHSFWIFCVQTAEVSPGVMANTPERSWNFGRKVGIH
jgi:hypothetical protein